MNSDLKDVDSVERDIDALNEAEKKKSRLLAKLLDEEFAKQNQFVALKGEMGEVETAGHRKLVPSYTALHTLDWVGTYVKMGSDMPSMQSKIDHQTGRLVVDKDNAEEVMQRAPDWTRQPALAAYLIHSKARKFGTILAVVSPLWLDDPKSENWGPDGRALKSAISYQPLDSAGKIGLLDLSKSHVYALDGQHRVMGIRGVKELQDGRISLKKKEGTATPKAFTRDEFLTELNSDITHVQSVLHEQVSVEYIPAVLPGETQREASRRIRSVFVAINSYAKRPDKGENILLDESDGYAIVARAVGVHNSLFQDNPERINWKNTSLPKRSKAYTTLQALKDMATAYLAGVEPRLAERWKPKFSGQVPVRPEEADLESARDRFNDLWDRIAQLPVFRGIQSGDNLTFTREFPEGDEDGKGHLLLRPIGQTMLARVVGELVGSGESLDDIFEKIRAFDKANGFAGHREENIWWGVTYNAQRNVMITTTSNQELAAKLFRYMLVGAEEKERTSLRDSVKPFRTSLDGAQVLTFDRGWQPVSDFDLPVPVR